ncbi:MAG: type I restriction endonuclease [Liquorilactobacillus nagelii]|uniref:type I restriction endonuclease n=1 Tax=Liquorilactobacillus satsumensis TaxID=259059 RepID=UPI0039E978D5
MEKEEFVTAIKKFAPRVSQLEDSLKTEEATKTSLIMPFFQLLGYDVFNPLEFVPEFTADVGIKKGERIDYAIVTQSKVQMLIEAKAVNEQLEKHDSQLFRYFGTTNTKFSILTNGKEYQFFTDLDKPNRMDATPFMTIDLTNLRDSQISELFKFSKQNFDVDNITSTASELKYVNQFKNYLTSELKKPSDEFTKLVMKNIYDGLRTSKMVDEFKPIVKKGFSQMISETVSDKLSSALQTSVTEKEAEIDSESDKSDNGKEDKKDGIVTTPAEIETYTTVKVILHGFIDDDERITYRDNKSYFNVLLDDNIRKWVLRVYFKSSRNFIILNDDKNTTLEFVHPIDVAQYQDRIQSVVKSLLDK